MNIQSLPRGKLVSAHLPWKTLIVLFVLGLALAGLTIGPGGVAAQSPSNASPFVGHWQAIDVDGSDIRLTIAGPAKGPFQITWTESYFGFCNREPGIARGTGQLVTSDVLTAQLRLVCFTTGETIEFEVTWTYDGGTDTISSAFMTWHHANSNSQRCVAPPPGLTGWWPGDDGSNDLIAGRDGLLQGDAAILSGLVDMAFALDGDGDFVEVPHTSGIDFGPGNFTVDLWVNFNDTAGEQVLAEKWIQGDGYVDGWSLTKLDHQVLRLAIDTGNGEEADLDSGVLPLQPGKWYHVAATRQGAAYSLYLNGLPIAQNPEMGASNLSSPASLKFGHRGNPDDTPGSIDVRGFYLNGRIDEVEIYVGTALSEEQIMMLYQAGTAGKCKDDVEPVPELNLRVNYGHDWVESFYEAGHNVLIAVAESDGQTIRASAQLFTEPKDFWGGETGFQTLPEDWDPAPPDIQPGDWVFGWVDNGASAQVQIGKIDGMIDLEGDSIQGTINASWFADEVNVECFPWGSPEPQPEMKYDVVFPDGADTYLCSWAGEWDVQLHQDIGVGYFGSDGHWVANAFFARAPRILASVSRNWFQAEDFTPNAALTLSIFESQDPGASLLWEDFRTADGSGFVFVGEWEHQVDLMPGTYLVVSDGSTAKQLVLEAISLDVFDPEMDYLAGTAPATPGGRWVWVGTGNESGGCSMDVMADPETGAWEADFAAQPCDVTEDMWAAAQVFDEDGDATEANPPSPPNTRFTVFPEWNYLEGYEWPEGAVVSIFVDGKDVCSTEAIAGFPEWDPWNTFFSVNFPGGCAIEAGDLITLSSETLSLTHQVQELAITEVDPDLHTVAGTAVFDPEYFILHTWIHGVDESYMQLSAEDGAWLADFGFQGFDLQPGTGGRVELVDQSSNATAVDWYIPNPRFTVFPERDWFAAQDWPDGANVIITVEGKPECELVMESWGGFFDGSFPEGCDLVIGDTVTFTDDDTVRNHAVQNLVVTDVDPEADTVSGTADAGAHLEAYVHEHDGTTMQLTAEDGAWLADFGTIGFDLLEGMCGAAQINDAFGNATVVDWCIPNPNFVVYPESDWMEGYDWSDGPVTVTVEAKSECATEQISEDGYFSEPFPEGCNLEKGDAVAFTDGDTIRTHIVQNLAVTDVDAGADTVSGTADTGALIETWAHGYDTSYMQLTAGDGGWLADFGAIGFDLLEGMCGAAQIRDVSGTATAVDWCTP